MARGETSVGEIKQVGAESRQREWKGGDHFNRL